MTFRAVHFQQFDKVFFEWNFVHVPCDARVLLFCCASMIWNIFATPVVFLAWEQVHLNADDFERRELLDAVRQTHGDVALVRHDHRHPAATHDNSSVKPVRPGCHIRNLLGLPQKRPSAVFHWKASKTTSGDLDGSVEVEDFLTGSKAVVSHTGDKNTACMTYNSKVGSTLKKGSFGISRWNSSFQFLIKSEALLQQARSSCVRVLPCGCLSKPDRKRPEGTQHLCFNEVSKQHTSFCCVNFCNRFHYLSFVATGNYVWNWKFEFGGFGWNYISSHAVHKHLDV